MSELCKRWEAPASVYGLGVGVICLVVAVIALVCIEPFQSWLSAKASFANWSVVVCLFVIGSVLLALVASIVGVSRRTEALEGALKQVQTAQREAVLGEISQIREVAKMAIGEIDTKELVLGRLGEVYRIANHVHEALKAAWQAGRAGPSG